MTNDTGFRTVGVVATDAKGAWVYTEGWQSWSPVGLYEATAPPPQPADPRELKMVWRASCPPPTDRFQGEGLLAVVAAGGSVSAWAAADTAGEIPSIRASVVAGRIVISADGSVVELPVQGGLTSTLGDWASRAAQDACVRIRAIPPGWCSWYFCYRDVTESDVLENLKAADRLELPIEFVLVDDGYEAGIGDWLESSPRFGSLERLVHRIRDAGRRPGVWTAPFLVGANSRLAAAHPEWLVAGADAGWNWGQRLWVLDVTHPAAGEHVARVYRRLRDWGVDLFKLDFMYAGALPGRRHGHASPIEAYREGLRIIRNAVGPDAFLAGCGAPLLPSIGLVDAMRIGPDILPESEERGGTIATAVASAIETTATRSWMHARLWTNDPDCLIARPQLAERERWATHLALLGGVALSGDRLSTLDGRGLELTRQLLRPSSVDPVNSDVLRYLGSA
jgi:alpha-galactosidase